MYLQFFDAHLPKNPMCSLLKVPATSATAVSPKSFYRAAMSAGHSGYTGTALILRCHHGRAYIAEIYGGCTSAIASRSSGYMRCLERFSFLVFGGLLEILGQSEGHVDRADN